ncbi:MAG: winged helix DNA-binding protein [Candidatus Sifarchaeia archaeon]
MIELSSGALNDEFERIGRIRLTRSQRMILEILGENGSRGATSKEIQNRVSFASRTVRYALRKLLNQDLICRVPCLQDMRQSKYFLR